MLQPVVDYVLNAEKDCEDARSACWCRNLVVLHWWENLLHNRRADLLKVILLLRGSGRIIVINVPWYLERR